MNKVVWGARVRLGALVLVTLVGSASCGDMVRQGQASSYLIINALEGASGAEPTQFGGTLSSDVVTIVDGAPTVFEDPGRVVLALAMKDVGPPGSPTSPTTNNFITVTRYRVQFIRADGRNTEGVDVPYAFDGAITGTVSGTTTFGFTLVRLQAKLEAPLAALAVNGNTISTIAQVTFYGRDQTGRETSVTGQISINFANWGDPG
jgi:hypothetical protein